MKFKGNILLVLFTLVAIFPIFTAAQSTGFTFQGKLTDTAVTQPTNGVYDISFRLFNGAGGGVELGSSTIPGVVVTNGIFTANLDFGLAPFTSGVNLFLELSVRPAGGGAFTAMSPRQPVTSAPYAIKSLQAESAGTANVANSAATANTANTATNATQLGGIAANQYVQTTDPRLSDARTPLAGSTNYIQNTAAAQSANFNITGNGSAGGIINANSFNSISGYAFNGSTFLRAQPGGSSTILGIGAGASSTGNQNTFAGANAGNANTSGFNNSYFGAGAGQSGNGSGNAFFGRVAGFNNTANSNSFFGESSGQLNTNGTRNSFFGKSAGVSNLDGSDNSYFGHAAGANTLGSNNAFFGRAAGETTTNGNENAFFGMNAGNSNITGSGNTVLGALADVGNPNGLTNATAIGFRAQVSQSNSLVLGGISGVNGGTNTRVGIGTTAPSARFHARDAGSDMLVGQVCGAGLMGIGFEPTLTCDNVAIRGGNGNTSINALSGSSIFFLEGNNVRASFAPGGFLSLSFLGAAGSTSLCRNAANQISTCSSSLRYKSNIAAFSSGMSLLNRLRPISFDWKDGGMKDVGFGAEDVATVDPRLVTYNDKGEVEGVKYDRLSVVFVNAIKEQDVVIKNSAKQINNLQNELSDQKAMIAALKKLVCSRSKRSAVCKGGLK